MLTRADSGEIDGGLNGRLTRLVGRFTAHEAFRTLTTFDDER